MARFYDGKCVFITGASAGIGAALGRELARQGAQVVLAARRLERLDALRTEIEAAGGQALSVACDVTDRASLDAAVDAAAAKFGKIDIVVANAGFGVTGRFDRLTTEDFRRQFETNVFGVIETAYAALAQLKASRGQLCIVSSVMGRMGGPGSSPYCASKFAIAGLAESLYYDLAQHGIAVTLINPGVVDSDIRRTDNQGVVHEGLPDTAPSWAIVDTAAAAREIARAIARRNFEAVITGHGKVVLFVVRHFPRTFRFIARKLSAKKLGKVDRRKREESA